MHARKLFFPSPKVQARGVFERLVCCALPYLPLGTWLIWMLRQKISALHVPRHASSAKKSEHGGEQIKLPKPSSLEQSFPDFPGRGLKVWMHFTNRWIQDIPDLVHVLAATKIFPCQKKSPGGHRSQGDICVPLDQAEKERERVALSKSEVCFC